MAQEQVILDIKVDSAEAVTNIDRAQKALALLKDEQDKLDESYSKGTITYEEYMKATADCTEQIIAQKNAIKANNDVLKQNVKELTAADGSLSQMRAKLKQMTTAYDNMSKAEREADDKGGALLRQIQDQTKAIQDAEMASGRYQRNVGNYPKIFDLANTSMGRLLVGIQGFTGAAPGVQGATKAMSAGVKGLKIQLTQLLANPIVAVIAAVIIKVRMYIKLIEKVIDTMKSTDEGGTALAALFESFRPIMDVVNKAFGLLATGLTYVVKGITAATNAVLGLIPAFKRSGEAAMDYVKAVDALEEADRQLVVQKSQTNKEISELQLKMLDKEKYSAKEREAMAKQVQELERKNLEQEQKNERERIRLKEEEFLKEHGWQNKRGKEREEALNRLKDDQQDELSQMRAHYTDLETEMNNHLRRTIQREQQAKEEQAKEEEEKRKKAREAYKKRLELRAQASANELAAIRALEDAELAIMEEGEAKQIRAAELAYQRSVEDLNKQVEEQRKAGTLTEKAANAVRLQLIDMEIAYQQQVTQIQKKAVDERLKNEQDAAKKAKAEREKLAKVQAQAVQTAESLRQAQELAAAEGDQRKKLDLQAQFASEEAEAAHKKYDELAAIQDDYYAHGYATLEEYQIARDNANMKAIEADKKAAAERKKIADYEKQVQQAKYTAIMGALSSLQALTEEVGQDNKAAAVAAKTLALAQIAIETGKAIATAITGAMESAAATGPAAAFTAPAFIAEMTGIVLGGVASAISTVKSAKFAEGGLVQGAGTGTSDSIHARLSNGESVMTAKATKMFYDQLSAMNVAGGGVAFPNTGSKTAFASGGVVSTETLAASRQAEEMERMLRQIQPVVSVREITNVSNRVAVKERISRQ